MFVPHPGLVGHTVIYYMEQQRCFQLKQRHGVLWLPDHVTVSDHASRELKSLPLWDDLDVTQSSRRNDFSAFWPHSFGLSWSSTSSENAEHSAAFVSCQAASEQQRCEGGSVMSQRHLVYNLRSQNLMQDKGYGQENKTSCLYPSPQSVTTKDEPGGKPSIRRKDGDLLESPLALAQKDSSHRISIQSSCGLTNPQPPLPHQRPKERLASTSSPDATGGVTSQEASSEVLMEFLAELDNHSCTADLANGQEQRSASGPCEKSGEDKENKLPAEEQDYSLRRRDVYCSPGAGSSCPKANFDASADLFDISVRGSTKNTSATLHGPQIVSPWAGALSPNCITSEFMARQGKVKGSWNNSNYGLSFHDAVGVSAPKTSTPIAGSLFKSECSFVGILDFTPDPHSIPLTRPYHPDSLLAGKGSILSDLPLNKLPWDKAKCKRPRLPFKNPLAKQLISKFSRSTRSSNAEAGTVNPCGPPGLFVSRLSAKGLQSEDGGQEWSPPSEKIQDQDVKWQRRKRRNSFVRFHGDSQVTKDSPLFEKQGGSTSPSNLSRLAKVRFLPKKPQPEEAGIEGQPTCQQTTMLGPPITESLDKPSFVDLSRSKLFPTPSSVPHVADWSSELFPDHDHLPNTEATVSQLTS
ncbi:DNA damage-induced apoptosis suppressor protein isoform X2 [Crotalus tigris]|nr:DNA damage-induced apoptosis suppressor protein isoform X2 [Crotalus tigris]